MFKSRLIQRLIFDIILVSIFFLPIFTGIFLWTVFFTPQADILPAATHVPQFDEAKFTAITKNLVDRRHPAPTKPTNAGNMIFGSQDPFGP